MSHFIDNKKLQTDIDKLQEFAHLLEINSKELVSMASKAVQTPRSYHEEDLKFSINTIKNVQIPRSMDEEFYYRSKGKVLLGLSANEPLTVGIVPVISALITQNIVHIKPASINKSVQEDIISLLYKAGFSEKEVKLINMSKEELQNSYVNHDYVFWFGSYNVCKQVASKCLELGISYNLESEGNDIAILEEDLTKKEISRAIGLIIKSIMRHNGQTCQAIRGIFVPITLLPIFQEELKSELKKHSELEKLQKFPEIRYIKLPDFYNVPFESKAWFTTYTVKKDLNNTIEKNSYRLSLNVYSKRTKEEIIEEYSFYKCSRLNINADPSEVEINEPWGGLGKSGTSGISYWNDKFIDKTYIKYER